MHYFVRERLTVHIWTEIVDYTKTGWKKAARQKGGVNHKLSVSQCHAAASPCSAARCDTSGTATSSHAMPRRSWKSSADCCLRSNNASEDSSEPIWTKCRGKQQIWVVRGVGETKSDLFGETERSDFSLKERHVTRNTSSSNTRKVAAKRNGVIDLSVSRLSSNS